MDGTFGPEGCPFRRRVDLSVRGRHDARRQAINGEMDVKTTSLPGTGSGGSTCGMSSAGGTRTQPLTAQRGGKQISGQSGILFFTATLP